VGLKPAADGRKDGGSRNVAAVEQGRLRCGRWYSALVAAWTRAARVAGRRSRSPASSARQGTASGHRFSAESCQHEGTYDHRTTVSSR